MLFALRPKTQGCQTRRIEHDLVLDFKIHYPSDIFMVSLQDDPDRESFPLIHCLGVLPR